MDVIPHKNYTHYKGGKYRVLGVAIDSTNEREGRRVVVYTSLANGTMYARDEKEFTEIVMCPDGEMKQRFVLSV